MASNNAHYTDSATFFNIPEQLNRSVSRVTLGSENCYAAILTINIGNEMRLISVFKSVPYRYEHQQFPWS